MAVKRNEQAGNATGRPAAAQVWRAALRAEFLGLRFLARGPRLPGRPLPGAERAGRRPPGADDIAARR